MTESITWVGTEIDVSYLRIYRKSSKFRFILVGVRLRTLETDGFGVSFEAELYIY